MRTFKSKPKPFLDAPRRDWQFDAFAWLLRNCGGHARFPDTTLVLPTEEHFPDRGMRGHAAAVALFGRVRDHAGMADWPCAVSPAADPERVESQEAQAIPLIRYDASLDPPTLVGTFAHELARYLVETFEEPPPGGTALLAPAVDIAAVFLGFGVFAANSVLGNVRHALNEGELVHALALFLVLRRLEPAPIARHLNPHLRKYLRLAARDLAQHEHQFARLRAVVAAPPVDIAERTLPCG